MATYVYETLARTAKGAPMRRFEHFQSMKDAPLTTDPETGLPVHRVIMGGYGTITGKRGYAGAIAQPAACTTHTAAGGDCCGTC